MATVYDLYDFESHIERSVISVLAAGGTAVTTVNIIPMRSSISYDLPRIEVRCTDIKRASIQHGHTIGGGWFWCHYMADLEISIVTDRTLDTTQPHGQTRGRVRYLMSKEASRFVSPTVTYYQVIDMEALGSSCDVDSDFREDATTLRYRMEYAIPDVAYPSLPP